MTVRLLRLTVTLTLCASAAAVLGGCSGGGGAPVVSAAPVSASAPAPTVASSPGTVSTARHWRRVAQSTPSPTPTTSPAPTTSPTPTATATPTPLPTLAPTPTPAPVVVSSTSGTTYDGCPYFTDGTFTSNVSSVAAISASASEISATAAVNDTAFNFYVPADEQVNVATNATALYTVNQKVSYHSFNFQVPWQSGYFIEPLSDGHATVVQKDTCALYAFYQASWNGSSFSAYSGAEYNLDGAFVPQGNADTASGIPIYAVAVKPEEIQALSIQHALGFSAPAHAPANQYVFPASSTDGLSGPSGGVPYGARLRLNASFSTAGLGPQATAIANALKTYGMYLYDTGCCYNIVHDDAVGGQASPFNSSDINGLMSKLHITDFQVVQ